MKKIILFVFVLSCGAVAAAAAGFEYCPVSDGLCWKYGYFSKKENKKKKDITCRISGTEKYRGKRCYLYEVPCKGMTYFISAEENGVYIRGAKVSLPVFNFVQLDIALDPPVCGIRHPLIKGSKWKYSGVAHVEFLAFFSVDVKLGAEFTATGPEAVNIKGKKINAQKIHITVSRSWAEEKPLYADGWFGKGDGVIMAKTKNSLIKIKSACKP